MIFGVVDDDDRLLFEITLIATAGLQLPVDALLDTGFTYWLAIDEQDIDELGWARVTEQVMRTARGDIPFDIYLGKVEFDGEELEIPVHVGRGLTEVLLGRKWLVDRKLVVNLPTRELTLGA